LVRKVPLMGELWYAPKGPGVSTENQLLEVVQQHAKTQALAVKFEPELSEDKVNAGKLMQAGLVKTPRNVQFKATIIVDLTPNEEELLASFRQKTRYNIRLAARKGVTVEPVEPTPQNMRLMYEMMSATQRRAGFFLRGADYYVGYWKLQAERNQAQLFFAKYEGEVLAGLFATHLGSKGWYKDGGSFRKHTNLMAPYLLQWETMRWLKGQGATSYDMVGVPPRQQMTPEHIMYTLYQFKSGFEPEITEFIGCWDLPLSSRYAQWAKRGERVYTAYLSRVKRQYLY
jgi:peptidoglycan pentaglycine glycine transferase (the first glycine)